MTGPHADQPVLHTGTPLDAARGALILVHGRGAGARDILGLGQDIADEGWALLAPEAAGASWYPESFLAPIERNQPALGSALERLAGLVDRVTDAGLGRDRIVLAGFSQGGCLALEFTVRTGGRWGGIVGLSAGLIGPPGTTWPDHGSLDGTPVLLGCSDRDPHIPLERVRETATVLDRLGAEVTTRIYPGLGHTVTGDEVTRARALLARVA